jgi:hypothetical protein
MNWRPCHEAMWSGCLWSDYQQLAQLAQAVGPYGNLENGVRYVAQANMNDLCRDLVSWKQCRYDALTAGGERCQAFNSYFTAQTARELNFVNYMCIEHLDALVANQECFADYDLLSDIAYCGLKVFHSSACSEERMMTCAQQKITSSPSCGPDAVQFFTNVVSELKTIFLDDYHGYCARGPVTTTEPTGTTPFPFVTRIGGPRAR